MRASTFEPMRGHDTWKYCFQPMRTLFTRNHHSKFYRGDFSRLGIWPTAPNSLVLLFMNKSLLLSNSNVSRTHPATNNQGHWLQRVLRNTLKSYFDVWANCHHRIQVQLGDIISKYYPGELHFFTTYTTTQIYFRVVQ